MRKTALRTKSEKPIDTAELEKVGAWWQGILNSSSVLEYHYLSVKTSVMDFKQEIVDLYAKDTHVKELREKHPACDIVLKEQKIADPLDLYFKLQKIQTNKENSHYICINLNGAKSRDLCEYQKEIFDILTPSMVKEKRLTAICSNKEVASKLSTDQFKFDFI
jgi:hypothetical protein